MAALHRIIIIQVLQGVVQYFLEREGVYIIIAGNIPLVGKQVIVGDARHCKFRDGNAHFFGHLFYGAVHILHAQVLAHKAQEMPGAACNDNFMPFQVYKTDSIANQVAPCTGISAYEDGIIFSLLHFMYHECFGVFNHIAVAIKILLVEGYKFKKDIIV